MYVNVFHLDTLSIFHPKGFGDSHMMGHVLSAAFQICGDPITVVLSKSRLKKKKVALKSDTPVLQKGAQVHITCFAAIYSDAFIYVHFCLQQYLVDTLKPTRMTKNGPKSTNLPFSMFSSYFLTTVGQDPSSNHLPQ